MWLTILEEIIFGISTLLACFLLQDTPKIFFGVLMMIFSCETFKLLSGYYEDDNVM